VLALISLVVVIAPLAWSGLFTSDPAVLAAANLYLRLAGPTFAFVGLGLALYFSSQGAGKVLGPVLAATVRLLVIAGGGWWLAASGAPLWTLFALVGLSLAAYGASTAAAIYITPWGARG
jgi:Na+-driven multidrug efflux pump